MKWKIYKIKYSFVLDAVVYVVAPNVGSAISNLLAREGIHHDGAIPLNCSIKIHSLTRSVKKC